MSGEPRIVTAVCQFRGGPGREREAAEAWAFELTYYFKRGIGEPPLVTYENGVYTVRGLMTTTHPGDHGDVVHFDKDSVWDLGFALDPDRQARLRELYRSDLHRWDGRPPPLLDSAL